MGMNHPTSIEVRFRHCEKELARHTLRNLFRGQGWIWTLIAALFVFAVALVLLLILLDDPIAGRMSAVLLGVGLLAVLVLALTAVLARVNARRLLGSSKELSGELLYHFHKEGYEYSSEFSSAHVVWGALHSAIECDDAFLLFPSKVHFVLLPKRGFADATALRGFRELLRESLGTKAQLDARGLREKRS